MKKMKKFVAILMTMAMMLALAVVSASAEETYTLVSKSDDKMTIGTLYKHAQAENLYSKNGYYDPYELVTVSKNEDTGNIKFTSKDNKYDFYGTENQTLNQTNISSFAYTLYTGSKDISGSSEDPSDDPQQETTLPVVPIKKTVKSGTAAPAQSFQFNVAAKENGTPVIPGVTISTTGVGEYTENLNLSAFTNASTGVYNYTITEAPVSATGWTNESATTSYDLQVTKGNNGTVTAKLVKTGAADTTVKEDRADFTNVYREDATLSVEKAVEKGNLVNLSDDTEYTFQINLTGTATDALPSSITGKKAGGTDVTVTLANGTGTFQLKDGEKVTFDSLKAGWSYEVTETNNQNADSTTNTGNTQGTLKDTIKVKFTNTYNDPSTTGLATRIAPFVAMAVLAGGAVAAYFVVARKRQENE